MQSSTKSTLVTPTPAMSRGPSPRPRRHAAVGGRNQRPQNGPIGLPARELLTRPIWIRGEPLASGPLAVSMLRRSERRCSSSSMATVVRRSAGRYRLCLEGANRIRCAVAAGSSFNAPACCPRVGRGGTAARPPATIPREVSAELQRRYGRAPGRRRRTARERRADNRIIDEGCQMSSANRTDAGQDGER